MGYDPTKFKFKSSDTTGMQFNVMNDEGEWEEKTVSYSAVAEILNATAAADKASKAATKLAESFNLIAITEDKADDAARKFLIDQNFDNMTVEEKEALKQSLGTNGEATEADIERLYHLDPGTLNENAYLFGKANAEEVVAGFNAGLKDNNVGWEKLDVIRFLTQEKDIDAAGLAEFLNIEISDLEQAAKDAGYDSAEDYIKAYNDGMKENGKDLTKAQANYFQELKDIAAKEGNEEGFGKWLQGQAALGEQSL